MAKSIRDEKSAKDVSGKGVVAERAVASSYLVLRNNIRKTVAYAECYLKTIYRLRYCRASARSAF